MDTFFLGGFHRKIGLFLDDISMHFRVFFLGDGREWEYFGGC